MRTGRIYVSKTLVTVWLGNRSRTKDQDSSHAAVEAYDSQLNNAGVWPWEYRLSSVGHEAVYFNYEAQRQEKLDAQQNVTTIEVFGGEVYEEYQDGTLGLPDGATMQGFDTMELDIRMECPDTSGAEIETGAWDYWPTSGSMMGEDTCLKWEIHHNLPPRVALGCDATHALAWLQEGGD